MVHLTIEEGFMAMAERVGCESCGEGQDFKPCVTDGYVEIVCCACGFVVIDGDPMVPIVF